MASQEKQESEHESENAFELDDAQAHESLEQSSANGAGAVAEQFEKPKSDPDSKETTQVVQSKQHRRRRGKKSKESNHPHASDRAFDEELGKQLEGQENRTPFGQQRAGKDQNRASVRLSNSDAHSDLHDQSRKLSPLSILSAPAEWSVEDSVERDPRPHLRYADTRSHSPKSGLEVESQDGPQPSTSPNGFWHKAGRALDRVVPVIHPLSHAMAIENLFFGLLVLYSLFSATYQIGFDQVPNGPWLYFETAVDLCYYIDCALQFRVGYFSGTKLPSSAQQRMIELGGAIPNTIMDSRKVAWHYLTHWFLLDFVSSFPFDLVFANVAPRRPWALQFILLLKLLRLPRFWRARSQLRRFMSQSQDELLSLVTTVICIFLYCHVSGCIFWFIIKHESSPNSFAEANMWDDHGVERPLIVAPPAVAYLAILYFLIVSFASVGYGDLHPSSTVAERLWAIFNGAVSAICLGYVVGKITSLVFTRSERRMQLRERFDVLQRVVEREKLPPMLAVRLTQQLATIWESKIYRYNEEEMFNELPTHLRAEFLATWWIRHIKPSALFPHYFPYLRAVLSHSIRQLSPPGDYVVHEGQISRSIYIVWKGALTISSSQAVESHEPSTNLSNDPTHEWKDGEFHPPESRTRGKRNWTKEKATQIREWFTSTRHHGEDHESDSGASTSGRSNLALDASDSESEDEQNDRKKHHWDVGVGTVIGERALLNTLAKRMRERGPAWKQIKVTSIVMDVTARSIDETYLLRILVDDIIIDDFAPLLQDLLGALKHYRPTPPGVRNKDT